MSGAGRHGTDSRPGARPVRERLARWHAAAQREIDALTAPVVSAAYDGRFLATVVVASAAFFALAIRLRLLHGYPAGDEPAYLVISQTLQKYHSINVMLDYQHQDFRSFYPAELTPHVVAGPHGTPVPLHNIGGPLLWLPFFALWGRAGAVGFTAVVSVLIVANVYRFLRERQIGANYALLTTLLVAVGSPLYLYSSMSYVEPIGALIIIYATRVLLAHRPHPARIVLAAVGLAYAPWVHSRFLIFTVVLGLLLIGRGALDRSRPRLWPLLCATVPLVVGALGLAYFGITVMGSINPASSQIAAGSGFFQIPLHTGLAGTLFDRQVGLIPNFPLFLLVLPGILVTLRRPYWLLQAVMFLVIAPYLVLVCTFQSWWGGYCPPARFISVLIPLFAYYVAIILQVLHSWWLCVVAVLLGGLGYALALASDVHPDERFQNYGAHNLSMDRLGRAIDWPFAHYVPSSFQTGQAGGFWTWTAVTVGIGVLGYACTRPWSGRPRGRRRSGQHPSADPDQLLLGVK